MNYLNKLPLAAAAIALCAGFTSCSDDDNGPDLPPGGDITEIFPNGLPRVVDGATIATDTKGRVLQVTEAGGEVMKFDYIADADKAPTDPDVMISIIDKGQLEEQLAVRTNAQGYAEYAYQTFYENGKVDPTEPAQEWYFAYTADGQLKQLRRTEGAVAGQYETTDIEYTGQNITNVAVVNTARPAENATYHIVYGEKPIANKGNLMLFDECFGIDMDEMGAAYYAGLLGKATAALPARMEKVGTANYYTTFDWELNAKGLPTRLTATEVTSPTTSSTDFATFVW